MNKQEQAWAQRTESMGDFASPWSNGDGFRAYAYPVARTFEAAMKGFKGKRKPVIFHMLNTGEAGSHECIACGGKLSDPARQFTKDMGNNTRVESPKGSKPDECSTWTYLPGRGVAGGMHYLCSWSNLLGRISSIRYAV